MEPFDLSPIEKLDLSKKEITDLLTLYLIGHSARKYNYLYWNVNTSASPILCFSNLPDTKIERINDPALCFRLVKVQHRKAWRLILALFNDILLKGADKRTVHVIRMDYLFQLLKHLKYEFASINYAVNRYGTRVIKIRDNEKPLAHIVYDIHCHFLIDSIFTMYSPHLNTQDEKGDDVSGVFNTTEKTFPYPLFDGKLIINLVNGLDTVSNRLLITLDKQNIEWTLQQIKLEGDVFNVINKLQSPIMTIVSVRVYMHYFIKAVKAEAKKKALQEKRNGKR